MQDLVKISYEKCLQGSLHAGESRSLLCTEDDCKSKLICLICQEEGHKGHKVALARRYMSEALPSIKRFSESMNLEDLQRLLTENQEKVLSSIESLRQTFNDALTQIKQEVHQHYSTLLSNSRTVHDVSLADLKTINDGVVNDLLSAQRFVSTELQFQLKEALKSFERNHDLIHTEIGSWLTKYKKKNGARWFAHPDIRATDMRIRSEGAKMYKFALYDSPLGNQKKVTSWRIVHDKNNWVAIGLAHRKIVEQNSFNFQYSSVGHGAYMISSNGTSWSNIKADANNSIRSFKFHKNDCVLVEYDPLLRKVRFRKDKSTNAKETYELDIQLTQANDLCFGAVFYYDEDELQMSHVPVTAMM